MNRVLVGASRQYEVLISREILQSAGELTSAVHKPCRAAIITDDIVDGLYGGAVAASFGISGYEVSRFAFKNGELSKNLSVYENMLDFLSDSGITRTDIAVALGGGVTGDLAGFAAASYLRGIDFIQIPTTYLAAVDSSVGGKTGLNLKTGKNLCGAFHQPLMTLIDCGTFKTLPAERFADGMAETIKYGVISDAALFETAEAGISGACSDECPNICIEEIVSRCIKIKARFVREDEFDNGARQMLNFGHTFGHAIERCSGYSVSHGAAVGIGMLMAAKAALKLGFCGEDCVRRIAAILKKYGLPLESEYGADELAAAMQGDKKRRGNTISLILPEKIGCCRICDIPVSDIKRLILHANEEKLL